MRRLFAKAIGAIAAVLLITSIISPIAGAATGPVVVSLTFDDNALNQFNLAYNAPGALKDSGVPATYFVNSGTIGTGPGFMSWDQLGTLASGGNDIGGKTVNAGNLTTDPDAQTQVCQDRQNLISHGITPDAFAYPGGATNATVEGIVNSCGYGNARGAGGLGPEAGAPNSDTIPAADGYASLSYAPQVSTLENLESIVTNANSKGGGWIQVVLGNVCSQTLDAANYSSCSASWGHIELADLTSFLAWVKTAGQANAAPSGTTFSTVGQVSKTGDSTAPVTTATCNGAACVGTPYPGTVTVALSASDTGSSVSSTHYTTDGTDPTLMSPTYTGPFAANGTTASTTVKFRSFDFAGNTESTQTLVIQSPADTTAPTTTISCNSAACTTSSYSDTVSVALTATDTGTSGLANTYFTTDGSAPTTSSTAYTAPFSLPVGPHTVNFFSVDFAGNSEAVHSQVVNVVAHSMVVGLNFDDGTLGQYNLAYLHGLQPHNAHATFFLNSGTVGFGNVMPWDDVSALAAAGNDIGGKTISAQDLTRLDPENLQPQICDDRTALIAHGVTPTAFAYPSGVWNTSLESTIAQCGYGTARTGEGLGPTPGAPNAEPFPPADWLATRSYAPGNLTVANMESIVTNAEAKGGGFTQIVIGQVCDATLDAVNYPTCSAAQSHLELSDLNTFLDWMAHAGQPGGAPADATLGTEASFALAADTTAPTTAMSCNAGPCASVTFTSSQGVAISFLPTDTGSGPGATRYTTDGSDPTTASALYTAPFNVSSSTTVKFRTWDRAGNVEAVQSQPVTVVPGPDTAPATTTIGCNGVACTAGPYSGAVRIALTAVDNLGGWGVSKTYYTLDGTAPTTSSPVYAAPFFISINSTIRFFSTDLAGNAEAAQQYVLTVNPVTTNVSLTFDDGVINQYSLGYLHALQPHGVHGTFFLNSGPINDGDDDTMTWADAVAMQTAGNDIGGHTVDHPILTDPSLTQQQKIDEICNDRTAIRSHGLAGANFAYPTGAFDANIEQIAANCGYTSARSAGGVTAIGPTFSESIPPADRFGTLAWSPPGGAEITLSELETVVNQAARHGGGWVQIVNHQVCDQTLDPANYTLCKADFGSIELSTLNSFIDWLQNRGTVSGAPAGTVVRSEAEVLSNDNVAPTSSITCRAAACTATPYVGAVSVALSATDNAGGAGVSQIYYTTNGTTPTTASTVYTAPFNVTTTSTVKYFAVDKAANAELVKSQLITIAAADLTAPTTTISCNGAACSGFYRTAVSVALAATDNVGGSGVSKIYYTTNNTTPTTASTVYTAPFTVSANTTVRFFAADVAGNKETPKSQAIQFDTSLPVTTIRCNNAACTTGWYKAATTVTLTATDTGSGVSHIYYTTNGTAPTTASSVYASGIVLNTTTTIRYFAVDAAGNQEVAKSATVKVDATAPTVSITSPANNATVRRPAAINVTATAADTGGSGLASVSFYLDGTRFATDTTSPYSGSYAFTILLRVGNHTLTAIATDVAGNTKSSTAVTVKIT